MIQIFIISTKDEFQKLILVTNLQDEVDAFVREYGRDNIQIETYETEKPFCRVIGE